MTQEYLMYLAGGLMVLGALFSLLAAVGLLRLPDLYLRMHAASKAGTMGAGLFLASVACVAFDVSVVLRALAGFVFLLLTAPVGAHLLAKAAYFAGYSPSDITVEDEMATPETSTKKPRARKS
jgi:multicomponent Na+:H+ antiporter subunit G